MILSMIHQVEFKNPYSVHDMKLIDVCSTKDFVCPLIVSHLFCSEEKHNFHYPFQAAMFCTTRKWCYFVVQINIDIHIERIGWILNFGDYYI